MAKVPKKPAKSGRKPASKPKSNATRKSKALAAKAPRKRKAAPKAVTKAPRKKRVGPVTTKVRQPRNWRGIVVREMAFVGVAIGCGLMITGTFLWSRAQRDVAHYLANPPVTLPGTIYSAPMTLKEGQQASLADVATDLLAAGYERVDVINGPEQFRLTNDSTLTIRNPAGVTGLSTGDITVTFAADEIRSVSPERAATFHPIILATVGETEGRRSPVTLDKLSPWMEPALLAMEDSRFREHRGVDPRGILRALVHNLAGTGGMHGGSTLTQQLAKNLFLSSERTIQRKIREAFFAASLEANLSKDELLELYLSEVYLGQAAGMPIHGVEQAARAWFGVSAARLDLGQAATIAGVISAPNRYSPTRHPERAAERRDLVLSRMVSEGRIQSEQAENLISTSVQTNGQMPGAGRRAPWAVDAAVDFAEAELGSGALFSSGHSVYTTIQPTLQRAAERAVAQGLAELDIGYPAASNAQAALVAVRVSDGAVVAIVGGRDYRTSGFNRAVHAWRQAGSTVKPLTMLAAFESDHDLSTVSLLNDEPITRTIDGKNLDTPKLRRRVLRRNHASSSDRGKPEYPGHHAGRAGWFR